MNLASAHGGEMAATRLYRRRTSPTNQVRTVQCHPRHGVPKVPTYLSFQPPTLSLIALTLIPLLQSIGYPTLPTRRNRHTRSFCNAPASIIRRKHRSHIRHISAMSHHPRTSRPKPPPAGNEEANEKLNLGEFQNVDTLTLSEAALVLNALVAKRRNDRKNVNETEYAPRES